MNDADIMLEIKTWCDTRCTGCLFKEKAVCQPCMVGKVQSVLGIIDSKNAKIERLQKAIAVVDIVEEQHKNTLEKAKVQAIKEFAERLKESAFECDVSFGFGREHYTKAVTVIEIDNLVQEMTEVGQHE